MKTRKNRKLLTISLFTLLLVSALLLGAQLTHASADDFYQNYDDMVKTNEPHLINDAATQKAVMPEAEGQSDEKPDSAALLQSMVQDIENNTFSQSGWLHYIYYLESEVPNGVALPQNYYCDGWFFIDDTGNVTQHIVSYYDEAGNLNQREIFKDNTFTNMTTNEKMENGGPYRLKLDSGVIKYMLEMQTEGSILTHAVSTIDEKPIVKFTVIGNYDKPTVFGNASQPAEGVRMTILFDQETGAISEMSYVYLLVDDSETLFYKIQTITLEWGDLPQEFVSLLESK